VITPVDDAPDNPASIIEFLLVWTQRIRKETAPDIANRLFLFVTAENMIRTFENKTSHHSSDRVWQMALKAFCKDRKLNPVTLMQLRPALLDLGTAIHGGDLRAAQVLANHEQTNTTFTHYITDAQRQRYQEQLGEVMEGRSRWTETAGRIDVRERPTDSDIGSATPGWNCLDPYGSPFYVSGKLCSAYSMCPICPLGQLELTSSYACAQAYSLLGSLRRARETMPPQAWLDRFSAIENRLISFWLPQFSATVIDEARNFVNLPLLPTPE
jgi:hypothetical protein